MNTEFFIAKRILKNKEKSNSLARTIIRLVIFAISLSLAVMIISVGVVTGFKKEIRNRIVGFGSHIQILNFDSNYSYESLPVVKDRNFISSIKHLNRVDHIQVFATKPGIIKTETDIQGIIVKGVGSDYKWDFFKKNIKEGDVFQVNDSITSDKILISKYTASLLQLNVGDKIAMYFIDNKSRPRGYPFIIHGIYETSLEIFDKQFVFADISRIQKINDWSSDEISGYEVLIDNFNHLDKCKNDIIMNAGITFYEDGSTLKVISIKDKYSNIFQWLILLDMNVWIILGLMLLVAIVNMISGLLILILDRIRMIGILKSVGTNNISIIKVFIYKSAFIIARGLLWGNVIGIGICIIQKYFKLMKLDQTNYFIDYVPINIHIPFFILLNIMTLLIVLSLMLLPSIIISNINPVKTLRYE